MRLKVAKSESNLSEALDRVAAEGERIVLTRRGKRLAALISLADLKLLENLEDRVDRAAARRNRAEGGRPVPLEKVMAELGIGLKAKGRKNRG